MRKLVLLLAFYVAVFGAPRPTQDDFNVCYEKNKASIISVNGNYGVAVSKNLIAVVKNSDTPINDYVKFDPYLGLYLVKSDKELFVPVMANELDETKVNKTTWIGTLSDKNATLMGHIKGFGLGLGDLDTLNFDVNVTAELNSPCCKMIGIAIGTDKFIPNRYLRHFAAYDDVYYGDIGVVFEQKENGFFIGSSDPLGRGKALMKNDEILAVDNKVPTSLRWLNEAVLFATKGTLLEFKIKRNDEELKIFVPVSGDVALKDNKIDEISPKVGEFLDKMQNEANEFVRLDEILSKYGIAVDKNLVVTKVNDGSEAANFGVSVNDKILQFNKDLVKNKKDLDAKINTQSSFLLLFRRGEFDFFARVVR